MLSDILSAVDKFHHVGFAGMTVLELNDYRTYLEVPYYNLGYFRLDLADNDDYVKYDPSYLWKNNSAAMHHQVRMVENLINKQIVKWRS